MAKEFPIRILVEEIALGAVLRKLNDMPGVVKLDLDFGEGGRGPGKEKLQQAAAELNVLPEEAILKALANGPMKSRDLIRATGMKDHRVYYAIGKLGLKRNSKGEYQAMAPSEPRRRSDGRAAPGRGPEIVRAALAASDTPLVRKELRDSLQAHGMSAKSVNGILDRAKRDGLIKLGKEGFTLTAKGRMNGEAHG